MLIQFTVYGAQCDICKRYFTINGMQDRAHNADVFQTVYDISSNILNAGWRIIEIVEEPEDEKVSPKIVCNECSTPPVKIIGDEKE